VAGLLWAAFLRCAEVTDLSYKQKVFAMRGITFAVVFVVSAVTLLVKTNCAQTVAPAAGTQPKQSNPRGEQPKPEDLLRRMADYLGNLPAVSCRIEFTIRIQASGMDNRMASKLAFRLQRPNRLAIVLEEGMMGMTVVSDGKTLSQYLPMLNRYTVQDAPADMAGLANADGAAGMNMIGLPGAIIPTNGDDFYKALMEGVTGSEYLGTEDADGVRCHHCRFIQEDVNWEIWIEDGEQPLVRKLVPNMSKQLADAGGMMKDAKLEYSASFANWNVAPKFSDDDFKFEPPATAEKVDSLFGGLAGGEDEGPHPLLGQPAPPFKTVGLDEKPIDLETHLGKSVVMLDFWATWCGPCVEAMPQIDGVAKKLADRGLVFYAVNAGEDAETIQEFLKTSELDVPVAMDADSSISQLYKANAIPQTVLIGKDGKVQVVHVGLSGNLGEELTKEIEDLLAGKDLAAEALAKAEEAKKKRAAAKKNVETIGAQQAWSIAGNWSGVAVPSSGDVIYAARDNEQVAVVDADGQTKQEIPTKGGGTLRLAILLGDAAPEIVLFQAWQSGAKAFSSTGTVLWEYPSGDGIDDVWPADVNRDGMDEVIIGFNGGTGLHVLDNRGTPLWKFNQIGNVWHVTAGDFNRDEKVEVVTTSAQGAVHVFDAEGKNLKDIRLSIYGHMVRMAKLKSGQTLAIVAGSGDGGETLVGVDFNGEEKFEVALPTTGVDHVDDMAITPNGSWAAVAMRGGLVNIVDLETVKLVARVADQGMSPHVAWLERKDQSPLLVVATGTALNAFVITPTDLESEDGDESSAE
jgi:peroxiredoxin